MSEKHFFAGVVRKLNFPCNVFPVICSSIVISMNWQPVDSLHLHKRFFFSLATTKIVLAGADYTEVKSVSAAKVFTKL